MAGICIISFDCEGRWGLADQAYEPLTQMITDENLRESYDDIFASLTAADLPATFACVQLFLRDHKDVSDDELNSYGATFPYLRDVRAARADDLSGWHAPWLLDAIPKNHEIGLHGFTHIPWSELSPDQARAELANTPAEFRRTLIYPRNDVAHTDLLAEYGCEGYRVASKKRKGAAKLLAEANPYSAPAEPIKTGGNVVEIPGGYFINWQRGARRHIPQSLSRMRARNCLRDAAKTGGVAHFWIHPENIATHPKTMQNFQAIVDEVARAHSAGDINVMTQIEYCRHVQSESAHG